MELKKELLEWYNHELAQKNVVLHGTDELANGYHFLEVIHNYHPKSVDLTQGFAKNDKN